MRQNVSAVAEDYLATIYALNAEGKVVIGARLAEHLGISAPAVTETLQRLTREGLVTLDERKEVHLTDKGKEIAEEMVRRHRLAERWLTDVLGLDWADAHTEAHRFEHAMSPKVEERLAKLLGNPQTCPHGSPIPGSGASLESPGQPLDQVGDNNSVVVERVTEEAEIDRRLLDYLQRSGITPGARLDVMEVAPWAGTMTIEVNGREVVLGLPAAAKVLVRAATLVA